MFSPSDFSSVNYTQLHHAWLELVNTITPGPQSFTYFIPRILLTVGLLVPPDVLSHNALATLFMPVILASNIHAWMAMRSWDVVSVDTLWWAFFILVFRDPRKDFRRLVEVDEREDDREETSVRTGKSKDDDRHGRKPRTREEDYPKDFSSRLRWVLSLLSSRPLTCWKTGDPSHDAKALPPYIKRSRWTFLKSNLVVLLPAFLVTMPLALQLKAHDPFSSAPGQSVKIPFVATKKAPPIVVSTLQQAVPMYILRPLTLGLYLYSLMILLFLHNFFLPVVLTLFIPSGATARWSPHTWPRPHFGPFSAVLDHGLRGLWGQWWHQQMRHAVSEPGRWLSAKLRLRKGGLTRYAMICCSAFLLSGLTHAALVPPEPRWAQKYKPWELRLGLAAFFWVQPAGILAEVMLIESMLQQVGRTAPHSVRRGILRVLRLCWVVLFMCLALPFLHDPFIELGYWKIWPLSFLPESVKSILRGDWLL